jgi:phosphopentomutase
MPRAILVVADGFGVGAAPDAKDFGDVGANTLMHIAQKYYAKTGEKLSLPNLAGMGLGLCSHLDPDELPFANPTPIGGAYGAAAQISTGKDTPSGHWEMTGVPVLFDWGYYPRTPECFPADFLSALIAKTQVPGVLGCCHASGTDIIKALGEEHVTTGKPICYTSADSVFQVAAHEEHFGLDRLYEFCEVARAALFEANIGRVIARPFIGDDPTNFTRTGNRRDYSIEPPAPTLLDQMSQAGKRVSAIGKISDIFAHRGISNSTKATGLEALIDETVRQIETEPDDTLIFTNLVNFDQDFGHRRDPIGFAEALQYFDARLDDIRSAMRPDDLLIITADHGCDPTWRGTDHTREYVPILAWRQGLEPTELGLRETFSDIGQTLASFFNMPPLKYGHSFIDAIV